MEVVTALDEHLAWLLPPPGSPGDLGYQLEGLLSGAKIGKIQAGVGGDHTDEGDAWKIVAFG